MKRWLATSKLVEIQQSFWYYMQVELERANLFRMMMMQEAKMFSQTYLRQEDSYHVIRIF